MGEIVFDNKVGLIPGMQYFNTSINLTGNKLYHKPEEVFPPNLFAHYSANKFIYSLLSCLSSIYPPTASLAVHTYIG